VRRLLLALAALALAAPVPAAERPAGSATFVVAFPAGGADDTLARVLAPELAKFLGRPVAVENVGGASGMTAAARVAKAAPDGSEFILGSTTTHALSQALHKNPPYNSATDFTPVVLIAEQPYVAIARRDLPVQGLREFAAYARANEGKMAYGSAGAGSATHLACALLNAAAGIKARHVPSDGGAAALKELAAGGTDYFCPVISIAIPQIEKERVKGLAVLTKNRAAVLPNLPTAEEQGLSGLAVNTFFAVFLPKATPEGIVRKLHDATVAAMESPAARERLKEIGAEVVAPERRSGEYLQKFLAGEIEKWSGAIAGAGLKAD